MSKRCLCIFLSLLLSYVGIAAPVNAAVITTGDALATQVWADQLGDVQRKLERDNVKSAMVSLGVDPGQAQERVAVLTQAELAMLSSELDRLPAGGDILGLIGAVFVVLLILELTGVTNIFTNF